MNYYLKRIGQAVLTLFTVTTFAFVLFRLMPGGPLQSMRLMLEQEYIQRGQTPDQAAIEQKLQAYTGIVPDEPIWQQYVEYMVDVILYQDFGTSIYYGEPVFGILLEAMPWSIFISVFGLALGYTVNILLGALLAYKEGSKTDSAFTVLATFLNSVPYYVVAILLIANLALQVEWIPKSGRYAQEVTPGFHPAFIESILLHAMLPIASSFVVGFGGGALSMRGNAIRILGEDYLRVARLRGISASRIATRYVARNAILPMYTKFMIGIASIFSSSVILEQIFVYPGVGWYTYDGLRRQDYPLMMASFIFFTTLTILGVLLADFTYGQIDPRVKSEGQGGGA